MSLAAVLEDPDKADAVVADGVRILDEEVAAKRGIAGVALRAGYKAVKAIKPGVIAEILVRLLPQFAEATDPFYAKAKETGDVHGYFAEHDGEIADALLEITDARVRRSTNRVIKRGYRSLRPQARKHTRESVPRVAELIEKHVG